MPLVVFTAFHLHGNDLSTSLHYKIKFAVTWRIVVKWINAMRLKFLRDSILIYGAYVKRPFAKQTLRS